LHEGLRPIAVCNNMKYFVISFALATAAGRQNQAARPRQPQPGW
jgi:hypothetical protein